MTKSVVLSTLVLVTGVVQPVVTVLAAVLMVVVDHCTLISIHDLAVKSSRVSVALGARVPVGK